MQIETKLPKVGTTIFTVMSQLAMQHKAVNLGQGFPDFEGPQSLRDALSAAMQSGKNQYAPMTGVPKLREGSYIAIELNTRTPVPEWDGQEVYAMQEDPAYLTAEGWCFFVPRQEAYYVIP